MHDKPGSKAQILPRGVMLNAYPDSVGTRLADTVTLLERPEFEGAFSLFYILPTFFNSDLDRGFSIIDYDLNEELVTPEDLKELEKLGIQIKLDLVLNHLSVRSPQFQDLLLNGENSPYRDFFIDWDEFWRDHGAPGPDGLIVPDREYLDKLFMRKPDLPLLRLRFPDGSLKAYWNTFYQEVTYQELSLRDLSKIPKMGREEARAITQIVNGAIAWGTQGSVINVIGNIFQAILSTGMAVTARPWEANCSETVTSSHQAHSRAGR